MIFTYTYIHITPVTMVIYPLSSLEQQPQYALPCSTFSVTWLVTSGVLKNSRRPRRQMAFFLFTQVRTVHLTLSERLQTSPSLDSRKNWQDKWQCVTTNSTPVVHIKIAGKWMFIPLKMVFIGVDPYPSDYRILLLFCRPSFSNTVHGKCLENARGPGR